MSGPEEASVTKRTALADRQGMTALNETRTRRVESLTAHVAPELAAEVRRLADAGNRSVSREVAAALRERVAAQTPLECRGPEPQPAVEAQAHGGEGGDCRMAEFYTPSAARKKVYRRTLEVVPWRDEFHER